MKHQTLLIVPLAVLIHSSHALDAEAIRKLAAEPHDREQLLPELKIYPVAREYKITARSGAPGAELREAPAVIATEKVVQGRYLISEAMIPGAEKPLVMVVTFDKEASVFKKWVLTPDGTLGTSTGVADQGKRTIAWVSKTAPGDAAPLVLSLESHSDDKTTWKETILEDGEVVGISDGVAVKTK
ncbi:hypothetical protein [Luteolibacter sp. Populi]|uniref:hypothetical protein n=1 Tax=Luteolibacter sp. Populi TaxID=3230487 RepID=UPI0034655455